MTTKSALTKVVVATFAILMMPLTAMLFTDEVAWDFVDFITAAGLLLTAGGIFAVASSDMSSRNRNLTGVVIAGILVLLWLELAVGIFS